MVTGRGKHLYENFNFLVEIDGIIHAAFHEASGFDSSINIIEHRDGGGTITNRRVPDIAKLSNITLKKWVTYSRYLYDWYKQWLKRDPVAKRKNGSIILLDRQGKEKIRWNIFNAWPSKWTGPSLTAEGNAIIAIETLELAHEGIEQT
jgi:phage tail-like protein